MTGNIEIIIQSGRKPTACRLFNSFKRRTTLRCLAGIVSLASASNDLISTFKSISSNKPLTASAPIEASNTWPYLRDKS